MAKDFDFDEYFRKLKEWLEGKIDLHRHRVILEDEGRVLRVIDALDRRKAVIYVTGGMVRCQGHEYFIALFRQFVKEVYHAKEKGGQETA